MVWPYRKKPEWKGKTWGTEDIQETAGRRDVKQKINLVKVKAKWTVMVEAKFQVGIHQRTQAGTGVEMVITGRQLSVEPSPSISKYSIQPRLILSVWGKG